MPKPTDAAELVAWFEAKLTPEGIAEAIRYETQATQGCMMATALIYLATKRHPKLPLSNSYLLHELAEAMAFRKLGFDFSSKALLKLSHMQRGLVTERRREQYQLNPAPHLEGTKEEYEYIQAVARTRGYELSFGTLLKYDPIKPVTEYVKITSLSTEYEARPEETRDAIAFYSGLLESEPGWGEMFASLHDAGSRRYFFEATSSNREVRRDL